MFSLPFEILRCSTWSGICKSRDTRSNEFLAHTFLESSFQLQRDRSPKLLGVRSSDWYFISSRSLLSLSVNVFCFQNKGRYQIWAKPCDFGSDFRSISLGVSELRWDSWTKIQKWDIWIWDIGIRHLQFREGSPEPSWFEYELQTRLPYWVGPIQPTKPCVE